jgi:hypothetical protein
VSVLLFSCQPQGKNKAQRSVEKVTSEPGRTDDWARMRECAAQAERDAKSVGWDKDALGWENHYSSKYERCFVAVSWAGPHDLTEELYDAFERRSLATCGDAFAATVDADGASTPVSRLVCDDFIRDRMAH